MKSNGTLNAWCMNVYGSRQTHVTSGAMGEFNCASGSFVAHSGSAVVNFRRNKFVYRSSNRMSRRNKKDEARCIF